MHVPDGLLDLKTASATAVLSLSALTAALRRLRLGLPRRRIPLMGLTAAFLFAAQMLNFPVAGGTSGHLLGAVLASVLLGPSAAVVVMTAVLLTQCLLFADGGLLALGANVFNMAIVGVLGGYAVYKSISRVLTGRRGLLVAAAFASWFSTVLASLCCATELAWSGVAPWGLVFPAMATVHMLIGLGEAAITTLVIAAIMRVRPDLVDPAQPAATPSASRVMMAWGLATTFGLLLFAAPFASSWPDGLERVGESLGFAGRAAAGPAVPAPMAEYRLPGLGSATAATSAAGFVGTLVAFALAYVLAAALAPRAPAEKAPGSAA
jgi:cobalt/nickel transport system permease protein